MKKIILITFISLITPIILIAVFWHKQEKPVILSDTEKLHHIGQQLILDVRNQDPGVAMNNLAQAADNDAMILRNCHTLAHEIGNIAYEKYHDVVRALSYKNEICGSGYFHGVIESYIGSSSDLEMALNGLCNQYTDIYDRGNCYHGVGHGLMFISDNDLPTALMQCDTYPDHQAKIHCSEGVFMENFNSDLEDHPSDYLNVNDPLSICRSQKVPYQKATCYFYAPLFYLNTHPQKYLDAFNWCLSSEKNFIDSCIKGVASRATKENIKDILYVENLCSSVDTIYQPACAEGIGSYYTTEYADRSITKTMCLTLRKEFQQSCLKN